MPLAFFLFLCFGVPLVAQESSEEHTLWLARQYASAKRYDLATPLLVDLDKKSVDADQKSLITYDLATIYLNKGLFDKAYTLYAQIDLSSIKDPVFQQAALLNTAQAAILLAEERTQQYQQHHEDPQTIVVFLKEAAKALDLLYTSKGESAQTDQAAQFLEERILNVFHQLKDAIFIQRYSMMSTELFFTALATFLENSFYSFEKALLAVSKNDQVFLYAEEQGGYVQDILRLYNRVAQSHKVGKKEWLLLLYSSFQEQEKLLQLATDARDGWKLATVLVSLRNRATALKEETAAAAIKALLALGKEAVNSEKNTQKPALKDLWQFQEADILQLVKSIIDKSLGGDGIDLQPFVLFWDGMSARSNSVVLVDLYTYFSPFIKPASEQIISVLKALNSQTAYVVAKAVFDSAQARGNVVLITAMQKVMKAVSQKDADLMPIRKEMIVLLETLDSRASVSYLVYALPREQNLEVRLLLKDTLEKVWSGLQKTTLDNTIFPLFLQSTDMAMETPSQQRAANLLGEFLVSTMESHKDVLAALEENISFQKELIALTEEMITIPESSRKGITNFLLESAMNLQRGLGERLSQVLSNMSKEARFEEIRPLLEQAVNLSDIHYLLWKDLGPLKKNQKQTLVNMVEALDLLNKGERSSQAPAATVTEEVPTEKTLWLSKDEAIRLYLEMDRDDRPFEQSSKKNIHEGIRPW